MTRNSFLVLRAITEEPDGVRCTFENGTTAVLHRQVSNYSRFLTILEGNQTLGYPWPVWVRLSDSSILEVRPVSKGQIINLTDDCLGDGGYLVNFLLNNVIQWLSASHPDYHRLREILIQGANGRDYLFYVGSEDDVNRIDDLCFAPK
jgi:hypothetical protein